MSLNQDCTEFGFLLQFCFQKQRSDTWVPKGMFSAPSGRSAHLQNSLWDGKHNQSCFLHLFQCVPHINECVSELDIKFMFGNEVQGEDSQDECNEESWVENWHNNVTELFCPKMSKLIKKSQDGSLFMNQTIEKKLPKSWNRFVICRVLALDKNTNAKGQLISE